MTVVMQSIFVETVREERVTTALRPRDAASPALVADTAREHSIGSFQALALAIAAAVVTTVLTALVL